MYLEERAAALCTAPTGCALLLTIEENGIPPEVAARPDVAVHVACIALNETDIWRGDHDAVVALALEHGPRLRDLARDILKQPDAAWWFAPVDRAAQLTILGPGDDLSPKDFLTPSSPPTPWERYAQKPEGALRTSTAVGDACAVLAAMAHLAADHYPTPPIGRVRCQASARARVYEVDGPHAWHALASRYPALDDRGAIVPDWGLVAVDWDAIHLTLGGLLIADQVRVESSAGWTELTGWPPEQTVWLRWRFEELERLPDLAEPPPSPVPLDPPVALWVPFDELPAAGHIELTPTTRLKMPHGAENQNRTEWIVVEKLPDTLPTAVLYPAATGNWTAGVGQTGVLVMHHWLVDGRESVREIESPFPWPPPLRITETAVRIELGTTVAPVQVETRVIRAIDERGMPILPVSWSWCRYHSMESGCQIVRDSDGQSWSVALALPGDAETFYVSLRAAWGVPVAPAFEHLPEGATLDAAWLFAVRRA